MKKESIGQCNNYEYKSTQHQSTQIYKTDIRLQNPAFNNGYIDRQKINKETVDLGNNINQVVLTDIHRIFYPTTAEYTLLSNAHGTFSRIEHILGHKTNLNNFRKLEIIPSVSVQPQWNQTRYQ
jgi:hypothetical protein